MVTESYKSRVSSAASSSSASSDTPRFDSYAPARTRTVPGPGKALASITAAHSICLPRAMARMLLPGSTSTPSLASLTRRYTPMALYLMGHKYVLWDRDLRVNRWFAISYRTSVHGSLSSPGALSADRFYWSFAKTFRSASVA
jgi:hypothetical protein